MKRLVLFLLMATGAIYVQAQEEGDMFDYGIRGGMNLSSFTSENIETDSKTGYYAGGYVEYNYTPLFHVQGGLMYSTQGATETSFDVPAEYKLDYVHIPALAKLYFVENFNFFGGLQFGFLFNEENEIGAGASPEAREQKNVDFRTFDLNLVVGTQYFIAYGIFAEVRYFTGFSSAIKDQDVFTSVWQFGLGVQF